MTSTGVFLYGVVPGVQQESGFLLSHRLKPVLIEFGHPMVFLRCRGGFTELLHQVLDVSEAVYCSKLQQNLTILL
ncbi:hypothetical protein DNTS_003923 [Danionella cerebrum]|uniref:Uncharacterized protein n=1 Tax=Danionella cerebrum TaxID=2873325 RepID=A0A553Q456_9TELE|nr:hypothetical protein DNTS_003923 [Danionella translucida]